MFYAIAITVISLTAFIISIIRLRAEMRFMDAQVNAIRTSTDMLMQVSNTIGFTPTSSPSRKLSHIWIVLEKHPAYSTLFYKAFASLEDAVAFCKDADWHTRDGIELFIGEFNSPDVAYTLDEWDRRGGDYFFSYPYTYSQNDFN